MTFLGWTATFGGFQLRVEDSLQGLKDGLLGCLHDAGSDCDFLKVRILLCRNRGQLILVRADVMQFLSKRVGEEAAATRLKGAWKNDHQMQKLRSTIPSRHEGGQRFSE